MLPRRLAFGASQATDSRLGGGVRRRRATLDGQSSSCFNPYMPAVLIPVTGAVLDWAIADAGFTPGDLATQLNVPLGTVQDWIKGTAQPNKGQFDKIVKLLGRPESFFFLAQPPAPSSSTAKFRSPAGAGAYSPSPDDLKAIRLARDLQRVAHWLAERRDEYASVMTASITDPPEKVADAARQWIGWSTEQQLKLPDYQVAKLLRSSIETHGVIALNLTLTGNGLRGFSLPDDRAPVLAINTRDDTRARSFSYVHELAHIMLGSESVCAPVPANGEERWCDRVAGALLMPAAVLADYVHAQLHTTKVDSYEQVRQAANKFAVSLRAMAIRLEQLGLGVTGLYAKIHAAAATASRGGGGLGPPQTRARRRLQRYGSGYVSRLFEAVESDDLDKTDLIELLNLSRGDLRELNMLLAGGADG